MSQANQSRSRIDGAPAFLVPAPRRQDQLALFSLGEPADRVPERLGAAVIGIREKAKVLHDVSAYWDRFDYSLNPFVGCGFGCSYCYAAFFVPDEEKQRDWGRWVDVKVNGIREIVKRRDLQGKRILMSTATDPYQPLERKVELTRGIVEALSAPDRQPILRVQTRSPIVTRDIDLFRRFKDIRVNMSVTTDSEAVRKRFEPGCASIDQRLEAIAQVKAAGVPISVFLAPLLPIEDPDRFGQRIAEIGPDHVYATPFNITDGYFKGSTRQMALDLARDYGWTRERVDESIAALRRRLPAIVA
ncbi:MAG TPA: radical SAM protein [Chthonomonadaceae bacterium]|nr:radical SAM protein [Chthonomonadaceae bacterium]